MRPRSVTSRDRPIEDLLRDRESPLDVGVLVRERLQPVLVVVLLLVGQDHVAHAQQVAGPAYQVVATLFPPVSGTPQQATLPEAHYHLDDDKAAAEPGERRVLVPQDPHRGRQRERVLPDLEQVAVHVRDVARALVDGVGKLAGNVTEFLVLARLRQQALAESLGPQPGEDLACGRRSDSRAEQHQHESQDDDDQVEQESLGESGKAVENRHRGAFGNTV